MSRKPWDKIPGESAAWYGYFLAYLHADKPRSFLKIYNVDRERKGKKRALCPSHAWNAAFDQYRWQERCDAFDAEEAERIKQEYKERIELQRQRELKASDLLFAKAEALVELPHLREKIKVDGEDIVLIPDHFAFKTAKELFAESKSQARGALEMTEQKQSLELDLSKLSADALSNLLIASFREEEDAGSDSGGNAEEESADSAGSKTTERA